MIGKWEMGLWRGDEPTVEELEDTECDCCGAEEVGLSVFRLETYTASYKAAVRDKTPPFHLLCHLCAGTMASVWKESGNEYGVLLAQICFIGNELLKAIQCGKVKP